MKMLTVLLLTVAVLSSGAWAEAREPLFQDLPAGVLVESSAEVPSAPAKAIGQKLGGEIQRLTNSILRVHGRQIQVNVITAVDESSAQRIQSALGKIKPPAFVARRDKIVCEYVGSGVDEPLAIKTSYELGMRQKPSSVQYRVVADLATIDAADYMACNSLFNQLLSVQDDGSSEASRQIDELSKSFTFGRTLALRHPSLGGVPSRHTFKPPAAGFDESGPTIRYAFDQPSERLGIPFVTATLEIQVDDTGFRSTAVGPSQDLTAATTFWPADDPKVKALALRITDGQSTNLGKANAILNWLAPGKNLRYSGQTGSRWGTLKVLGQKFGRCWDFSDCFITLARASGVPSRQVAGWLYGSDGHVWAEYYQEGQGWQQVDPTGGGQLSCGIYHIPYLTSEDGEMPIVYVSMPRVEIIRTR
jgi:hypothetical protein